MNCYSLLYQLLDQQQNVDKLLAVKLESEELRRLVTTIADTSANGAERLQSFAKQDDSLRLDETDLPAGEVATRKAIASTKTKELLKPFNSNFEFALLLTQSEALSYAWHLAKVAAEMEAQPDRARFLADLAEQMKRLHHQAVSLMRSRLVTLDGGTDSGTVVDTERSSQLQRNGRESSQYGSHPALRYHEYSEPQHIDVAFI